MIAAKWVVGGVAAVAIGLVARRVLAGARKPARDMTIPEALDVMRGYARDGVVQILDEGSGSMPRMTIGPVVAGVRHVYLDTSGETPRAKIDNLDPRFAVYLVRLDQLLASMGVDTLGDLGITHGGSNPDDAHNMGRALDLRFIRGPGKWSLLHGKQPIDLDVLHDWGERPESAVGTYRLRKGDRGFNEFRAIYDFAVREGADRCCGHASCQEGPPSTIGFASCTLGPDHPSARLRVDHRNHFHLQAGPTTGAWA